MRTEIMFAGFGGQGIVKAALLLAGAAGLHQGKYIAQTQSYGPEARGGACKAEVVISDRDIAYIKTRALDALVVMSQPALDQYRDRIDPEKTRVIYDATLVTEVPPEFTRTLAIPATALAEKKLGRSLFANIIMLGALAAVMPGMDLDALTRALVGNVPPKTLEANGRALTLGFDLAGKAA